jgi:hypothetical protein
MGNAQGNASGIGLIAGRRAPRPCKPLIQGLGTFLVKDTALSVRRSNLVDRFRFGGA